MDEKHQKQEEMRAARRKRRIRNQILAYIVLVVFLAAAAAGIVAAVKYITQAARSRQQETQQESMDAIDDLLDVEDIPTPEPTVTEEPVVEQTPEEKLDEIVNAVIDVMPLEDKVAGLFIVTPEAITGVSKAVKAGEGTKDALSEWPVGGLVYFKQNMQSAEQLEEMLHNTALYARAPLFLAVDEEGGSVARLASAGLADKVDSAGKIGLTGDPNNAYQAGVTIGTALNRFGFNLDFAPVADIAAWRTAIWATGFTVRTLRRRRPLWSP